MTELWHDAFYHFVSIADPARLVTELETLCREAGVLGSVLVAEEGVNGMLAGRAEQLAVVRRWFAEDERFALMPYKRSPCRTPPFERLKIRIKSELVPLGIEGVDPVGQRGTDVSPAAWRDLIAEDDVLVIDNRNAFEYDLGHFAGAINPGVDSFRGFADYVKENLSTWQDKRVAMYCTGGIRCEKTSAWLRAYGLEVLQLEGGILNYFAELPDADREFKGECFVFDNRVALDTRLRETETTLAEVAVLEK